MATKKTRSKRKPSNEPTSFNAAKRKKIMSDVHAVFRQHGVAAKVESLSFAGNAPCTCPDGSPGVWKVINGHLVCDCS